ncbi:hypothetical protein [Chitinolyticbacter albus]|uniref:hypothetical protein n=1 Tax=Chitinolyticbacter albus TaxID=2961951 RepID=UPI00210E05E8|nr:hypothetical protein [Chitinolyticbacter albus]
MRLHPNAKMVDIRIVEVPYQWKGMVPARETNSEANSCFIILLHEPSGTQHMVKVDGQVSDTEVIARLRAKAKIEFVKLLLGDA